MCDIKIQYRVGCLKVLYDDRYHMHLGYYENGFDLEGQQANIWQPDVYCYKAYSLV
ncbi:DUF3986 family protein [Fictibacillus sp. S7]|uniref:DUF3986 family protein n=1 Tax=Fictibacillus sp. S7 TaxID=2212476 RepID=UPI003CD0E02E